MRKGTPRWFQGCTGISVNSTFDSMQWLVASSSYNSTNFVFAVGPYDGATTPSF
jgi:hypothetical protein